MFCWEWAFLQKLPFLFFRFFFWKWVFLRKLPFLFSSVFFLFFIFYMCSGRSERAFLQKLSFLFLSVFFCFSVFFYLCSAESERFCGNCLIFFCPFFLFFLPVFSVSVFAETAFSVFVLFFSFSVFFYLCSAESERFCGNRSKKENAGYKLQHAWKTKKIIRKFSRHKQIRCMKM